MTPLFCRLVTILIGVAFMGACSTSGTELKAPMAQPAGDTTDAAQQIQPLLTGQGGFTLRSESFEAGQPINEAYTFDGGNSPPPLTWDNAPPSATELALVMRNADREDTIYWVVSGISPDAEGVFGPEPPPGAIISDNEFNESAYHGPDSPAGVTETYVFTLYALAQPSGLAFDADPIAAVTALEQSAFATSSLSTTHTG